MNYEQICSLTEQLDYRNKLRLAQLLIQLARKEEENQNPQKRNNKKISEKSKATETSVDDASPLEYVIERISKSQPGKKKTLTNFITAMFQFQGGISEADVNKIINDLQKFKHIKIDSNNRVSYL